MKVLEGYACPSCGGLHDSIYDARRCCEIEYERRYQCEKCGETFPFRIDAARHEERCKVESVEGCDTCRHRDANDGRRHSPCGEYSGAPVHEACGVYEQALR